MEPVNRRDDDACRRRRSLRVEPDGGDARAARRQHVVLEVVGDHEALGASDREPPDDGIPEPCVAFLHAEVAETEDLAHEGLSPTRVRASRMDLRSETVALVATAM